MGIGYWYLGEIDDQHPIWSALSIHRIENRLTTLRIFHDHSRNRIGDFQTETMSERLKAIHVFLCESPLLKHLELIGQRLNTEALWGHTGSIQAIPDPRVWACRRLRSLSIRFQYVSGSDSYSDLVAIFGYFGRVCPLLEQLRILVVNHIETLRSGLCLLTRLTRLRELELRTVNVSQAPRPSFQKGRTMLAQQVHSRRNEQGQRREAE